MAHHRRYRHRTLPTPQETDRVFQERLWRIFQGPHRLELKDQFSGCTLTIPKAIQIRPGVFKALPDYGDNNHAFMVM